MGLAALMVVSVPSAASAQAIYELVNVGSKKCMTNGGSTKNSAPITQYTCASPAGSDLNQLWASTGTNIFNYGLYEEHDIMMCLTNGGSTKDSAPITQYTCNGSANQNWYVAGYGLANITISNNKNFCMTTGGATGNSDPITQYTCEDPPSNNQQWYSP
jgi:Ricin-type beta-trefoil lectin domain